MGKSKINIEDFNGFDTEGFKQQLRDLVEENATEVAQNLHQVQWERNYNANYSAGWTVNIHKTEEPFAEVWNEKAWQLTWLLENGHLIVNKKGGVGWAAPHPHIKPAYDRQVKTFERDIDRLKLDIDFK